MAEKLMEKKKVMKDYYDELFSEKMTFREQWEGKIAVVYRVPKEVGYVIDFLKDKNPENLSILEIGAGDGVSSKMIINALKPKRYVATDLSEEGVKKIQSMGIEGKQADATNLKGFKDNSFDMVCCFNVMHHVDNPRRMAQEMLRVTRKHFILCESNAVSIPRKLLELTPRNRRANENSYKPSTYRKFFESKYLKWVKTKPFMFAFAFTPDSFLNLSIRMSEALEKMPLIKWQGSSVLIVGEKN
ncbi:MAG: class I SAM-dependent methyltransferase [Nanoarchaeota archaeon]